MLRFVFNTGLAAIALGVSASAQTPIATVEAPSESSQIRLRYASFDPLTSEPAIPAGLRSTDAQQLWIVQFNGTPTQAGRDAIAETNGEIVSDLPDNAYVVRSAEAQVNLLEGNTEVRWVGSYHPAYRLDPELIENRAEQNAEAVRFNIVVANKRTDKPGLMNKVRAIGGTIEHEQRGSILLEASLTGAQLLRTAGMDEVLWIDRWSPVDFDMDNVRIQGGANYIEAQAGYTGAGVNAHIYEGLQASHPDFTGPVINVRSSGNAQTHGHATGGIVFGNGTSNPAVRGMAPDAGKFYTNSGSNESRYEVVDDLVNIHNVSHTTASWGNSRTFFYTSISADSDDIAFDHDIAWTQSQSNAGNQNSRPQAWAKNIFSIGGVRHNDNSDPSDDSWQAGNASIGPASDGRIKPTLCAYYDNIGTSDRTGNSGYSSNNWTSSFGGTSGATPIVAGHNVLAIQMFTDEVTPGVGGFGNPLRIPGGTSHENRPHFPTLKALQVVSAEQYAFTGASTDNRREHQGWGFPNLENMWDSREKTLIVDETDVMTQGQTSTWSVNVDAGEPSLKACLNWSEPAGNPSASSQLVNDLSLRVTSPSGTIYWGNTNLENGLWSTPGGTEDDVNSIECVFVENPAPGPWTVEVIATAIVADNHVETPAVDADYGLVVVGGSTRLGISVCAGVANTVGAGAQLDLIGSAEISDNDLTISVAQLPPNQTCLVVTSTETILLMNPGGSQGNLCIAGLSLGRFTNNILNSGPAGEISFAADLTMIPTPMGPAPVMAGETRYFQCWYRDIILGVPISNFSSARGLTFN